MDAIRWLLSLVVYGAMIAVCILQFEYAGMGGLIGGGLGFVIRYLMPGQTSGGERLGNGYVGSLTGIVVGFAAVGLAQLLFEQIPRWVGA